MSNTEQQMTMEKFNDTKKKALSTKMTQAILGQSQEKGNVTSVFKTEVERESYLDNLSLSDENLKELSISREQFDAAKNNIRSDVKEALAVLRETSQGGTVLNYKKREAALKKITDMERPEKMKQQAAMLNTLKGIPSNKATAPVIDVASIKEEEYAFDGKKVLKKNTAGVLEPFNGEGKFSTSTLSQEGIFENGQIVSGKAVDTIDSVPNIYVGTWSKDEQHLFTGTVTIGETVTRYENNVPVQDAPASAEKVDSKETVLNKDSVPVPAAKVKSKPRAKKAQHPKAKPFGYRPSIVAPAQVVQEKPKALSAQEMKESIKLEYAVHLNNVEKLPNGNYKLALSYSSRQNSTYDYEMLPKQEIILTPEVFEKGGVIAKGVDFRTRLALTENTTIPVLGKTYDVVIEPFHKTISLKSSNSAETHSYTEDNTKKIVTNYVTTGIPSVKI